ncbi:hypothetical protein [Mesorhizobium sp.]|uniref:hypothetical protein n=1 Tax=Mesorhizobium sp. TaxID=1871066 RepID=UPI000FE79D27|nr:hypothetical protein [Mesorhizobium sp.]RWN31739.1 MAG: hypothetical protein EOR95_18320 [Mesorhizobium sp.]
MPNTTVRAAAEGMPDVNRRRLLLGLAAGATATGATAPALAAASTAAQQLDLHDPLADTIVEYRTKLAVFHAIPTDDITEANEDDLMTATYGPAAYRLWKATPAATSLRGVAEAIRYAFEEDAFIDRSAESVLLSALAFLEREHGL